jgi:hypothetical protein
MTNRDEHAQKGNPTVGNAPVTVGEPTAVPTVEDYVAELIAQHNRTRPIDDETRRQAVSILATIPMIRDTGTSIPPAPGVALNASPVPTGEAPVRPVQSDPIPLPAGPAPDAPQQNRKSA